MQGQAGRLDHRALLPGVFALFILMLSGCATQTQSLVHGGDSRLPRVQELASTPFFPQELYQCGPAALATLLQASGIEATPDQLVSQVYIPQREGSLQAEMIAAGRRNGALSVPIPPRLDALLTEVASGSPVVVLQNLSLPIWPLWHYAVVIGFDLDRAEVILRSGTSKRLVMSMATFERTWARSDYWAMVALAPGNIPVTGREEEVVPALAALEKVIAPAQAQAAYTSALRRWPDNLTLHLGLGNASYAAGDMRSAAAALQAATAAHPHSVPAFNNLATVLAESGDYEAAVAAAERAVELGGEWESAARATLASVQHKQRSAARK